MDARRSSNVPGLGEVGIVGLVTRVFRITCPSLAYWISQPMARFVLTTMNLRGSFAPGAALSFSLPVSLSLRGSLRFSPLAALGGSARSLGQG